MDNYFLKFGKNFSSSPQVDRGAARESSGGGVGEPQYFLANQHTFITALSTTKVPASPTEGVAEWVVFLQTTSTFSDHHR